LGEIKGFIACLLSIIITRRPRNAGKSQYTIWFQICLQETIPNLLYGLSTYLITETENPGELRYDPCAKIQLLTDLLTMFWLMKCENQDSHATKAVLFNRQIPPTAGETGFGCFPIHCRVVPHKMNTEETFLT
jgi:hypothetical protein